MNFLYMKKAIIFGVGQNYEAHKNIIPELHYVEVITVK